MQRVILILLVSVISCFCNEIIFTKSPEVINPGELINLQWNYTDIYNYKVEIKLCCFNECQKLAKTKTKDNQVNATFTFEDVPCFFKDKPVDNWYLLGTIKFSETNTTSFRSGILKRNLICDDETCKEDACNNYLRPENNTETIPNNNTEMIPNNNTKDKDANQSTLKEENNESKKIKFPYLSILFQLTLIALIITACCLVYINKFKKKEEDPIPIFSVEDSSYCCDMSVHSPVLGQSKTSGVNQSSKAADQSHLSVQLHPINPVNDYYSHSSQNSNRTKGINPDNSYKISHEIQKQNKENGNTSDHSNSGSPYLAALSPISMASSIPLVLSPKPKIIKKKSFKYDNNVKYYRNSESPNVYADSSVIVDKKSNNSRLFSESPMLSDNMSGISKKLSFNSTNTDNEEETKVLSSKHYVLSNFEGDYNKEELNLHYGDIVSVINILPDGWAYGELLLKYNAYTKTEMKSNKNSKYRKFGYYPIKCLSPDEESDESNSPPKKIIEEENHRDLEVPEISSDSDSLNNLNYTNKDKDAFIVKEKAPLPPPPSPKCNKS